VRSPLTSPLVAALAPMAPGRSAPRAPPEAERMPGRRVRLSSVAAMTARLCILLALLATAGAVAAGASSNGAPTTEKVAACGIERWDVKTLTDPRTGIINLRLRTSSVWTLTHLRVRPTLFGPRRAPVETTVYQMRARLVASRAEADRDIHLIVAGGGARHEDRRPPQDVRWSNVQRAVRGLHNALRLVVGGYAYRSSARAHLRPELVCDRRKLLASAARSVRPLRDPHSSAG